MLMDERKQAFLQTFVCIDVRIVLDFDGRNNGLAIPRLDMATQTLTLFEYFSFPAKRTLSGHLD